MSFKVYIIFLEVSRSRIGAPNRQTYKSFFVTFTMEMSESNEEQIRQQAEELKKQARELEKNLPKRRRKKLLPKSIKPEEFGKLTKSCGNNNSWRAAKVAFLLAYESGLRNAEVRKLLPKDFDLNQRSIFVRQGKFGKDRVVPLPKIWRAWMFNYIPIPFGERTLQRKFKAAAKKAGIDEKYVFHSLRHGFATRSVEQGVPINQVQLLMGHSDISATNVYLTARPLDALKSYEELF